VAFAQHILGIEVHGTPGPMLAFRIGINCPMWALYLTYRCSMDTRYKLGT
jgi:hypothetical protein